MLTLTSLSLATDADTKNKVYMNAMLLHFGQQKTYFFYLKELSYLHFLCISNIV